MKSIVIVPARLGSERLPNKPLFKIKGKSIIRQTLERILASGLRPIALATDSELVIQECASLENVIPVITSTDHSCGTERVLEAYHKISATHGTFDLIINVQGDEPFIEPEMLKMLPEELMKRRDRAEFWTTVTHLPKFEENDINVAKVVLDMNDNALIFTRDNISEAYKHTSVYIYTPEFLEKFCHLPQSPLEKAYRLEQMRALDNGLALNCIPLPYDAISINTYEDLEKAGIDDFEEYSR